jgi:hypothetical protein
MKLLPIILFLLICAPSYAQEQHNIFKYKELGLLKKDKTFGGFDGGMERLKVVITYYSVDKQENTIKLTGRIIDNATNEKFCGIQAFIGEANQRKGKLKINKTFNLDCSGEFEIIIPIHHNKRLYFWSQGYSLLECEVVEEK